MKIEFTTECLMKNNEAFNTNEIMKKVFYLLALIAFTLASCDKNELNNNLQTDINTALNKEDNGSRAIRPVILGKQKENPFSLENMQIALDTLKKIVNESDQCHFKKMTINYT